MPLRLVQALAFILAATALLGRVAAAESGLYRARAIVTGQGEAERARGAAICLETVLVKVSGDPSLRREPALAQLKADALRFVRHVDYHDRMSGIPVHDEQGTRERPFDLTIDFDPAQIDAALASLNRAPWPEPRPRLAVLLGVHDATVRYVLAADGARGLGQREALAQTAERHGIVLALPSAAVLAEQHATYGALVTASEPRLAALGKATGGDAALAGTLVWTERALGWTARWRLAWHGRERRWEMRGVSFDDAFRDALDHAAAILSGHG